MKEEKRKSIKTISEKIANTMATFLIDNSDGFKVPATKVDSEKVPNMVGTFLNKGNGLQISTSKAESEKVTNGDAQLRWEPF